MSHFKSERTLRLERLEVRSLLAGGVIASPISTDAFDLNQPTDRLDNAPIESRDGDRDRRPEDRGDDRRSGSRQSSQRPLGPRPDGPRPSSPPPPSAPPTTAAGQDSLAGQLAPLLNQGLGGNAPPSSNQGAINQGLNNQGLNTQAASSQNINNQGLGGNPGPLDQVVSQATSLVSDRPAGAVDAAIASLVSESNSDAGENATDTSASEVTAEDVTALNAVEASSEYAEAVDANVRVSQEDAADGVTVTSDEEDVDAALIDTVWLDPLVISSNDYSLNDRQAEPWKLERTSIDLLRQILEQEIVERVATTNPISKPWFDGPGGLIALDQVDLPAIVRPIAAANVDVGLEATVALHRTVHLADVVSPAISGSMLQAIMATLDEVAMVDPPPLMAVPHLSVPVATYPAIAVAATTVAISTRRKHRLPMTNLQFTKRK
ncbi:MAG: hypothetical protein AAGG48_31685 [Planctomycetota bacterium]